MKAKRYLKNEEEIKDDMMLELKENGFSTNKGAICVLFSGIIARALSLCYLALETMHLNCFVSSADRSHLDKMAQSIGLSSGTDLSDQKLRYMIANHTALRGSLSREVLKVAIESIDESVFDVKFKPFVKGPGSVAIYVHSGNESSELLNKIQRECSTYIPSGTTAVYLFPKRRVLDFKISIDASVHTLSAELALKSKISGKLQEKLKTINKHGITLNDIILTIESADNNIKRVVITDVILDGISSDITRISPCEDEIFTLSNETVITF